MINREKLIRNWYDNQYNLVNVSASQRSMVFKYMHSEMEATYSKASKGSTKAMHILEVGATDETHANFIEDDWQNYVAVDTRVSRKSEKLLANGRLQIEHGDVHNLPYQDGLFQRTIATCVLHHLEKPEIALSEMSRVTTRGGYITIFLPHDPGMMYRLTRVITSARRARKAGLSKELQLIHALEHKNHFLSLKVIIENVFQEHKMYKFSFNYLPKSYNFGLYTIYQIKKC